MTTITESKSATITIPKTMRAAAIDRFGPPDVLTIQMLPVPGIEPDEVLIAVHSAGVAGWDADMREGWSPSGGPPQFPLVLGTDGSGTVVAAGPHVRRVEINQQVYAYAFDNPKGGFYAEFVAVPGDNVAPLPPSMDMKQAGILPASGFTALQGIDDVLHLKKGETILIHGASGAVGTLAVQFAKLRGARVLASASGEEGVALVRKLGADAAADGHRDDIVAVANGFAPKGLDAILALAGGETLESCIGTLRSGGRLAYPNGVEPPPSKRRGIETTAYNAECGPGQFDRLGQAIEQARLHVPTAAEFPLEEAAKAHERIAAHHVLGKIVLRVR